MMASLEWRIKRLLTWHLKRQMLQNHFTLNMCSVLALHRDRIFSLLSQPGSESWLKFNCFKRTTSALAIAKASLSETSKLKVRIDGKHQKTIRQGRWLNTGSVSLMIRQMHYDSTMIKILVEVPDVTSNYQKYYKVTHSAAETFQVSSVCSKATGLRHTLYSHLLKFSFIYFPNYN